MELWTEQETIADPTPDEIQNAIAELKVDEPAVLSRAGEAYIQTMLTEHGFLLEKREGSADQHYEAVPNDGRARVVSKPPWWAFWMRATSIYYFSGEEIIEAFHEYQKGNANPAFVTWSQISI